MNELGLERCLEYKEKVFSKEGNLKRSEATGPTLEVDYTLLCQNYANTVFQ